MDEVKCLNIEKRLSHRARWSIYGVQLYWNLIVFTFGCFKSSQLKPGSSRWNMFTTETLLAAGLWWSCRMEEYLQPLLNICCASLSAARSLCECDGLVAVHSSPRGGVQEPSGGVFPAAEPRRRPDPAQLSQQERRGHGPDPRAQRTTHLWVETYSYTHNIPTTGFSFLT